MKSPAVHLRFVGMLPSPQAEALAGACISGLDALYGDVARWEVCIQPPLTSWASGGYRVRAQANLSDGAVISIRAQGCDLEETVRGAFEGIEELLVGGGEPTPVQAAWMPTAFAETQAFS